MEQWQWQEAKGKFVEIVELSHVAGPQMVMRKGEETAVVLSAKDYSKLSGCLPSSVALLLKAPRGEKLPRILAQQVPVELHT